MIALEDRLIHGERIMLGYAYPGSVQHEARVCSVSVEANMGSFTWVHTVEYVDENAACAPGEFDIVQKDDGLFYLKDGIEVSVSRTGVAFYAVRRDVLLELGGGLEFAEWTRRLFGLSATS